MVASALLTLLQCVNVCTVTHNTVSMYLKIATAPNFLFWLRYQYTEYGAEISVLVYSSKIGLMV